VAYAWGMYYFWSNDQQVGPYTMSEVRALWNTGQITADSLYWETGLPDWQPMAAIVHLIQQPEPSPAPVAPSFAVVPAPTSTPQAILAQPRQLIVERPSVSHEIRPVGPALPLAVIHQWILNSLFALAIIAFFLPNLSVELPILGKINLSMLDLLTPNSSSEDNVSTRGSMPDITAKPNAWDLLKDAKTNVGGAVCGIAMLGLLLFYVVNVLWGVWFFAFKRTFPRVTLVWLVLAIQFPVLFTIGAQMIISGMRSDMGSNMRGNPFDALGMAMVNNISLQPGMVTWFLMALAFAGIALPRLERQLAGR
jgi:hypothetical protein